MVKEQYVNYDTAIMLKNRGFNAPCGAYYSEFVDDWKTLKFWKCGKPKTYDEVRNSGYLLVPSQSIAMRWLREVHNIFITVSNGNHKNHRDINAPDNVYYFFAITDNKAFYDEDKQCTEEYSTYEEACEKAIQYAARNIFDYGYTETKE